MLKIANCKIANSNLKFATANGQFAISRPLAGLESASGRCYAQDKLRTFAVAASKIVFHRQCLSPRN
jgi:hypothetical protein